MSPAPRPLQHLLRSEIDELERSNDAERSRLKAIIEQLKAEEASIQGRDEDSIRRSMSLSQQMLVAYQEITALLKDVQEINFERHVRNTPELTVEFGPGAD
ncbi:MAG: hypothetical protein J0J05_16390 [Microbacterium sp.]|jgi:hypothetical protein|uniref:hypothetical protein n=1 Tax=Microbacterium sp. TaxID=51671 RepID=UPI001AD4A104|nr:hypothetical protein [Microbacterium sp.]MBN9155561.1 hypothetical protein [Microbacterium sp.]